jgi:transcriptional regulator with XRE-family HTH domain
MTSTNNADLIKEDIGRNIYIVRKALGFNHHKLVEISGLTRPIISSIENASANPTFDSLLRLCNSLEISIDLLFMSKSKFEESISLLKGVFEKERGGKYEFIIPEKIWKSLLIISNDVSKKNYGKIAVFCSELITKNFNEIHLPVKNNMILSSSLGVIFQEDGFRFGLEFGAWLGSKFN